MREGKEEEGTPRTKTTRVYAARVEKHSAILFSSIVSAVEFRGRSLSFLSNFQYKTEAPIIRRIHLGFYCQPSFLLEGLLKAALSGLMGENNGPFRRRQNPSEGEERRKNRIRDVPHCCKTTNHLQGYLTSLPAPSS